MVRGLTGLSEEIVQSVFLYIAVISIAILVLITSLMIYFTYRYHRRRNPNPRDIRGNLWLEILWTVVPTLLVLSMFYYGWTGFHALRKVPEGALKVKVSARTWSWLFEYENGLKTTELFIPEGRPVHLRLSSLDVIHSFYIPAFRVKQDAVPGMTTSLWFRAKEAGTYDVLCAEYCGQQHAYMLTKVRVLKEEEFNRWYEDKGKELEKERRAGLPRGERLILEKGCLACHSTDGTPRVGPTLKGIFGKTVTVITEGKERQVRVDEAYLLRSLLEPNADLVKGFQPIMPSQKGISTEEELKELVRYMKELK
ncbi:MAG: cytochrome c oxidase subunit II [Desulfobacterota bacterium]|nr:cytochrome c oxidase subunit II [Thermodesulfobacteriota bacterium]